MEAEMKRKPLVLIVDDVPSSILAMGEVLAQDCEVTFAASGLEALRMAQDNPPDLVLLDVIMPGMNGYEVCRQLKQDPRFEVVPVIFLTAMGEESDEEKGLAAGAIDYITKPASPPLVRARVQNHLRLKELYEQQRVLIEELRSANNSILELQGLLPICAWCKKVRNDQGYWEQIEGYVSRFSGAQWTHGICPECLEKMK